MRWLGLAFVVLSACANTNGGNNGGGDDGGGGGGGGAPTPDAPPPPPKRARVAVLGDAGKGNTAQRAVAVAMRDVCQQKGCDFVLMLGDNIYDAGVDSVTDTQWQTKFEQPYADIDLPFYAALGNHDNGGSLLGFDVAGIGNEFDKGAVEVAYTQMSTKWTMPATHYTFTQAHVGFVVLDTNAIIWNDTTHGNQASWLPTAMMEVQGKDWVFFAGHHPYLSNGTHGNAGSYDAPEIGGISIPNPLPIQNGTSVKSFFDANVCGTADLYFSGHDHSRQWIDEPTKCGGTELIVSGAGATTTDIIDRGNAAFYEDATEPGFLYVDIDGNTFTGTFYDASGNVDYTRTFTKQ